MKDLRRKKGLLEEVFSKALHSDNPNIYKVIYREFKKAKELKFLDFLELSDNFETIPASRIILVKREDNIIYRTSRGDLLKLLE